MKNGILKKGVFHPLFVSFLTLSLCNLYILDGFWFWNFYKIDDKKVLQFWEIYDIIYKLDVR